MYLHGTVDYCDQGNGYFYVCRIRTPRMHVVKRGRTRMEAMSEALKFLGVPLESD